MRNHDQGIFIKKKILLYVSLFTCLTLGYVYAITFKHNANEFFTSVNKINSELLFIVMCSIFIIIYRLKSLKRLAVTALNVFTALNIAILFCIFTKLTSVFMNIHLEQFNPLVCIVCILYILVYIFYKLSSFGDNNEKEKAILQYKQEISLLEKKNLELTAKLEDVKHEINRVRYDSQNAKLVEIGNLLNDTRFFDFLLRNKRAKEALVRNFKH